VEATGAVEATLVGVKSTGSAVSATGVEMTEVVGAVGASPMRVSK